VPIAIQLTLDPHVLKQLSRIESLLIKLIIKENRIMADLTELTAEVERNTTVEQSAITLIEGFAAALEAAGTDPVKLQALKDQLAQNDDALAAAVAANTIPEAPGPTA
jgi:hypothetical protein